MYIYVYTMHFVFSIYIPGRICNPCPWDDWNPDAPQGGNDEATTITKQKIYRVHRRANGRFTESPKSWNVCGQTR